MKSKMTLQIILSLILIGILAGVLSGLVGVGGGIIMVPLLVLFFGFNQHQAQGTSLAVLAVPVTAVAVFTYYKEGQINIKYAAIIAAFFVIKYIWKQTCLNIRSKNVEENFCCSVINYCRKNAFG